MRHVMPLKIHRSLFNVIKVSLNGWGQCKIAGNELVLKPTRYDHYADRLQTEKKLSYKDLRNFMSNFELVNKKLKQRKRSVLVEHSNV